ncbi:hypothetical protein GCM10011360_15490 [Primorskyibacter flagellatus]|uniref:PRC-barrel domain-containing protein n=1 Tax=Primorskyibacter flagellatus TaxID=1387277 RepID=A0A917A6A5_9RHOB|nr:hypothetical protein [Primorskyibacter flagellatus]GGE28203.1 hypothetical protein GCM10011360_15490 [Primorskyibacter flagellatus]
MLTKTKTLLSASVIALMAVPAVAQTQQPDTKLGTVEAQTNDASDNFAESGTINVDEPRGSGLSASGETGNKTVDVDSTNRQMGIMKVSDYESYMRDDMKLSDSPLIGTAIYASDDSRVGIINEVYKTPEGDQLAFATVEEQLGTVEDTFAVRVAEGQTSVKLQMSELEFQNALQSVKGGEAPMK